MNEFNDDTVIVEITQENSLIEIRALPAEEAVQFVIWDASQYCQKAKIQADDVYLGNWDRSL